MIRLFHISATRSYFPCLRAYGRGPVVKSPAEEASNKAFITTITEPARG